MPAAMRTPDHSKRSGGRGGPPPQRHLDAKQQICFDFTKGQCARGASCRYSHDIDFIIQVNSQEKGICFDFLKGVCARGALCRFSHDLRNVHASASRLLSFDGRSDPSSVASQSMVTRATGANARVHAPICYDFVKGQCTRGTQCRYSHDYLSILLGPRPVGKNPHVMCVDFARGRCARGANCRYSHGGPSPAIPAVPYGIPAYAFGLPPPAMHAAAIGSTETGPTLPSLPRGGASRIECHEPGKNLPDLQGRRSRRGHPLRNQSNDSEAANGIGPTSMASNVEATPTMPRSPLSVEKEAHSENQHQSSTPALTLRDYAIMTGSATGFQGSKTGANLAKKSMLAASTDAMKNNEAEQNCAGHAPQPRNSPRISGERCAGQVCYADRTRFQEIVASQPPMATPDVATPPLGAVSGADPSPASVLGSLQAMQQALLMSSVHVNAPSSARSNTLKMTKTGASTQKGLRTGGADIGENAYDAYATMQSLAVSKLQSMALGGPQPLVPFANPKSQKNTGSGAHSDGGMQSVANPTSSERDASSDGQSSCINDSARSLRQFQQSQRISRETGRGSTAGDGSPTIGAIWGPSLSSLASSPFKTNTDAGAEAMHMSSKTPLRAAMDRDGRYRGFHQGASGTAEVHGAAGGSISLPSLPSLGLAPSHSVQGSVASGQCEGTMDQTFGDDSSRSKESRLTTMSGSTPRLHDGHAMSELDALRSIWNG